MAFYEGFEFLEHQMGIEKWRKVGEAERPVYFRMQSSKYRRSDR